MISQNEGDQSVEEELKWVQMRNTNSTSLMEKSRLFANPLVPLGAIVTAGVLTKGLYHFYRKDQRKQQMMMRYRILAQGVTIAIASIGLLMSPDGKKVVRLMNSSVKERLFHTKS